MPSEPAVKLILALKGSFPDRGKYRVRIVFCDSSLSYEHVFDDNTSNRTMKTFQDCAVYDTVRFDPAPPPVQTTQS